MTFILFVVLVLQGHPPIQNSREMGGIDECMSEAADILKHEPPENGSLQAGCVVVAARTNGT